MEDRASLELLGCGGGVGKGGGGKGGVGEGDGGGGKGVGGGEASSGLLARLACMVGVYDGHGGDEASELVAHALPEAIRAGLASKPRRDARGEGEATAEATAAAEAAAAAEAMERAFGVVSDRLQSDEEGTYGWVGSTATVALLLAGAADEAGHAPLHLVVGNLGDSDAVLLTRGGTGGGWSAEMISTWHRPDERAEEERICASGGYVSEEGSLNDMIAVS